MGGRTAMIDAFLDHMRACDIAPADPDEIIADDKRRRYRLEGDKPRVRNGSYQLKVEPDGFAAGWAMSFRDGTAHAWHSKSDRKASAEDRAAWKKKTADAKLLRDAQALTGAKAAADKAKRIWARASETGTTGYLDRKACGLHGARVWQGLVVVPMYGAAGLVGLQFIAADGVKRFLTDCAKEGAYFPITTKDEGKATIIICEGFATGAAIRQATGYPVVVAFDAGNLKPVALAMRRKYPDARIVIGADNDQWTKGNPGQAKAQQAALAIGGAQVVSPLIPDDDEARRTDWDDVARSDGLDAVRQAFEAAPDIVPDYDDSPRDYADPVVRDDPFRCLGHSRGLYYFLPRSNGGQVVALTASSLGTMMGLLQLHSSYDFWQSGFGDGKANDKKVATMAGAALIDMCNRAGVFRPETVRGAGAWRDTVGIVVNDGHAVITKDARVPLYEWRGKAIYEADRSIYATNADPLDSAGAVVVRDICAALNWQNALHGDLLAGWLVIAPFGSCLRWRPHVHLTGESGSGKSWVLENIVARLLGASGLVYGGQTEPGIRALIGKSGRPFVLDEAEPESKKQRDNIQNIHHLMRAASSGASVGNANGQYSANSCFMLSSINSAALHQADENRITQLVLLADKTQGKRQHFDRLQEMAEVLTPDFVDRLQARTMAHLDVLYQNEATFKQAAGQLFGKQRNADQIAPMIAGLYMLTSTKAIAADKALAWLKSRDWGWHTSSDDEGDAQNFLRHLMSAAVRYDVNGAPRESTIGRMIEMATDIHHAGHTDAVAGLRTFGLKVADDKLIIANKSPRISRLLENTSWSTWHRTLSDVAGADSFDGKAVNFGPGQISKVRRLPLAGILGIADTVTETELPFDGDAF